MSFIITIDVISCFDVTFSKTSLQYAFIKPIKSRGKKTTLVTKGVLNQDQLLLAPSDYFLV